MLVALVCLWIGFALGFLCAAMLRGGHPHAHDRRDGESAMAPVRMGR
jgi:hypothetical protein